VAIILVWSRLSLANQNRNSKKILGDQNHNIFSVGTIFSYDFNAFYEQRLNYVFIFHAIHTVHDYFIIVTHTLHLSERENILSYAISIRDCYYLPPLSQLRSLFINELSASGIVVFCSDQKFINVCHKKSTLKSR